MTTSEKTRTFLGMNIVGDITTGVDRKPQRPASELAGYFNAVFAGGVITGVRWSQYTPYFNDGDPCVFSANDYSLMIRLADRQVSEDELDELEGNAEVGTADDFREGWIETETYSDDSPMSTLIARKVYAKDRDGRPDYSAAPSYDGPQAALAEAVYALAGAIGGGEFDHALLELFGDHATVTVPASGDIEIECYEHD